MRRMLAVATLLLVLPGGAAAQGNAGDAAAVETWLKDGVEKAMNLHNRAPETDVDS